MGTKAHTLQPEAHMRKYEEHKEFLKFGIVDKTKYAGWYITAMYYAIYHLACYRCIQDGDPCPPPEQLWNHGGKFDVYESEFKFFEERKKHTLYTPFHVSGNDVVKADRWFPQIEEKLLA